MLRAGESYRNDGRDDYRYTDALGKRRCVYAETLVELRKKEDKINAAKAANINYAEDATTVMELVERYTSLKQGVRYKTKVGYNFVKNILAKDKFRARQIRDIRVSDAQLWFVRLQKEGKGYSTITSIRGVIKPAFQMACNEDIILKNPILFNLSDVVSNDSKQRDAMTEEEYDVWMTFIHDDSKYHKYYDEFVVLLGTGMRVSEFCGLTLSDLDFKKHRIHVDHQMVRERDGKYYVEKTKTKRGVRYIPMTEQVEESLLNIVNNRPKLEKEHVINGYTGFLLIDKDLKPKVALHIENEMRWAMKKFKKLSPETDLPHITPHVFRHTFCTNLASAGMDIKNLQYLMGHSDVGVTMNVYTHTNYDKASEQLRRVIDFCPISQLPDARKKSENGADAKSDAIGVKIGVKKRRVM
nr:site-specific integrase [Anaerolactibacter massiliensis]